MSADPVREAQFKEIFSIFDRRGVGRVCAADMAAAAEALGSPVWLVPPEELVAHFDLKDRGWFDSCC